MLSYCLKYRKNATSSPPRFAKTKKRKTNAFIKMYSVYVKNQDLSKNKNLVG